MNLESKGKFKKTEEEFDYMTENLRSPFSKSVIYFKKAIISKSKESLASDTLRVIPGQLFSFILPPQVYSVKIIDSHFSKLKFIFKNGKSCK